MENWIEKSHKAKIEITEEVLNIVQEAIEESIPLWFYMCIDGDHFTIDESQLQLDPPQPLGLHPLPNLASYHYQVLQELVRTFQTDCIKGYVSLVKAAEAVHKAVEYVHSTCKKNDLTLSMTPRIPSTKRRPGGPFEVWKDYTKEILKISSIGETQVIDWRCLLVSLVDVHYHNFISTASVVDILQAHISLKEATKGSSTYMDLTQFLGTRLWFDSDSVCDVGASMKKLFFIMLDSDSGIPWQSLLLYLCKDSETELALKKAHAAILGTLSENVSLTTHELLQAMYPCGIEGALDQGCQIWSLQDLQKLMEKQQRRQELESFGTESDDNRASRSGYDSDAWAKSTGACRGSKLSEQSTMSFQNLMMPYELQSISEKTAGSASSTSEASNQTAISGTQKKAAGEASASEKESNAGAFEGSSEFSERAVATMNDFLAACDEALGSQDESEEATREPAFTLQDLLASSELSSALRARFGTNSVLAMATHPC